MRELFFERICVLHMIYGKCFLVNDSTVCMAIHSFSVQQNSYSGLCEVVSAECDEQQPQIWPKIRPQARSFFVLAHLYYPVESVHVKFNV